MKEQNLHTYLVACDALRRSFAMMALAMISDWPREKLFKRERIRAQIDGKDVMVEQEVPKLQGMPDNFRAVRLPDAICGKLRERVARGDVTTIVPEPEPFTWLVIETGGEEMRTIYGIWVGRPASWRGRIDPKKLPHIGAMTVAEAEAKGIPVPAMPKE